MSDRLKGFVPRWISSAVIRHEFVSVSLLFVCVLAFMYHDIVFEGRSFLVGTGLQAVTATGPYDAPPNAMAQRFYAIDAGAIAWQMEPWGRLINHIYRSGELPLWDPYSGLGYPIYANPHSAPFDPLLALEHLVPDAWWPTAVDVQYLFRSFLALFFTYLFARELSIRRVAAVLAAVGYICATYFWINATISYVRAELLLPLLIYGYHRLAVRPSRKSAAIAILGLWLILVTGFPETLPLQLGAAIFWYVCVVVIRAKSRELDRRAVIGSIARLAGVMAASSLLAAFVLLPFVELFINGNNRHHPIAKSGFPLTIIADAVLQLFTPIRDSSDIIAVPNINSLIWILALSALPFTLRRLRQRLSAYMACLLMAAIVLILILLRLPILVAIYNLPVFNILSLGRNLPPIILFFLSCAAAGGLNFWLSRELSPSTFAKGSLLFSLATVLCLLVVQGQNHLSWEPLQWIIVLIVVLNGLLFLSQRGWLPQSAAAWLVVLLVLAAPTRWQQDATHALRYDPFTQPPFVDFLQQQRPPFRILGLDMMLFPNTSNAFGLDDVRYVDAVFPASYAPYLETLIVGTPNEARFFGTEAQIAFNRYLDLLNVQYVITAAQNSQLSAYEADNPGLSDQLEKVYEDPTAVIYRNQAAYPRAFIVHQVVTASDSMAALVALQKPAFDSATQAVIQGAPPGAIDRLNSDGSESDRVTVTAQTTNTLSLTASLRQPGYLIVSEQYYPGWYATVDDQPTTIYPANSTMRALYLDSGSHSIHFYFAPLSFLIGLGLALVTLITVSWTLYLGPAIRRARRPVSQSQPRP